MTVNRKFIHQGNPARVVFGAGARHNLTAEIDSLRLHRVLVVSTPGGLGLATELSASLRDDRRELYPRAAMHVPVEVAEGAVARAREIGADGCVAIGGGSAIGLAKAVAMETGLPVVAIPTTYAGSEMTPIWGLTDGRRKLTGRDPRVLPTAVIYDPELTQTLPVPISVTSAFNALAHSAEALYAPDCSPLTALGAAESVHTIAKALPDIAARPRDVRARTEMLYGSWLAGRSMGGATMSLHHKLCHVLGGTFGLPHSDVHTALLPHVLSFNLPAAPKACKALQDALEVPDPAMCLFDLAGHLGAEMALSQLGMPADGIQSVVDQVLSANYHNPRPVTETGLRTVLAAALAGAPPRPPAMFSQSPG